jgi:hypothetical protein
MSVGTELVRGAVDLYVHASPDMLPRRCDDLALAAELQAAGYRAAVHRHHYSGTAERAALAVRATGFDLRGALDLNASVGGVCPAAVEVALRMGAVWINLPTISATAFRATLSTRPAAVRELLGLGGPVGIVDGNGAVLDAVREVLALVSERNAVLATGYLSRGEIEAVLRAAEDAQTERVVLSNPLSPAMGMPQAEVIEVLETHRGVFIEESVYQHQALPSSSAAVLPLADCVPVITRVGVDRVVISSDGGIASAPPPAVLLADGCDELVAAGLPVAAVRRLVQANPARLLGL